MSDEDRGFVFGSSLTFAMFAWRDLGWLGGLLTFAILYALGWALLTFMAWVPAASARAAARAMDSVAALLTVPNDDPFRLTPESLTDGEPEPSEARRNAGVVITEWHL